MIPTIKISWKSMVVKYFLKSCTVFLNFNGIDCKMNDNGNTFLPYNCNDEIRFLFATKTLKSKLA